MILLSSGLHQGPYRVIMGNLADRVGPKKRFVREAGSLQQHLLSDSGDVSARSMVLLGGTKYSDCFVLTVWLLNATLSICFTFLRELKCTIFVCMKLDNSSIILFQT